MRLIRSNLKLKDVTDKMYQLVEKLYKKIPSGVGSEGILKLNLSEAKVLTEGSQWAIQRGFGEIEDITFTEEHGRMIDANPEIIGNKAIQRGVHNWVHWAQGIIFRDSGN